ncbi:MAG: agmatinase family protein [Myxococcaceae bacterium]|nr:agmatinase family protein [Myxococcaceae bacterium]
MAFDPNAAASPDSGVFGLPHSPDEAQVVLLPVPFEATTSYGGGTADGPAAILEASKQVDLFDLETGSPYEKGIAMLEISALVRGWNDEAKALAAPIIAQGGSIAGDPVLGQVDALCAQMNAYVHGAASAWLAQDKLVGLVGGDHSTPFGCIQAHAEKYPGMGVLHLDAHADLRDAYGGFTWSHASIMFNVLRRIPQVSKIVQVGIRDFGEAEHALIRGETRRLRTFFDSQLARAKLGGTPFHDLATQIVADLPKEVYLSFDIDGLDPTLCPHTGTPVPGGLTWHEVNRLVATVVESGRTIVGFDVNEVAPGPDGDEWDANVGARLLYKLIGWALKSRG